MSHSHKMFICNILPPFVYALQAHIREIFSTWGQVKLVDMPTDHNHPEFHRGYAYVEYITAKAASDAVNYMNGGQIDGQEVNIIEVLSRVSPARDRRRSTERQLSSKRRSIDRPISPRRRHNQYVFTDIFR